MIKSIVGSAGSLISLIGKSGVVESALSRRRRQDAIGREVENPPPGTPLLVSLGVGKDDRFGIGVAEHSGIYLGEGRVAELNGDGRLLSVTLSDFVNGEVGNLTNTRNGTCIFAACDDESDRVLFHPNVALNARELIKNLQEVDYKVMKNNCHMFTSSCLLGGVLEEISTYEWWQRGTFSIADLEQVVMHILNGGCQMGWRRVKNHLGGFDYQLTPEKLIRLYREGKIDVP